PIKIILQGTILGTIRLEATDMRARLGGDWRDAIPQFPAIRRIDELEQVRQRLEPGSTRYWYFENDISGNPPSCLARMKDFPYFLCSGLLFRSMLRAEVQQLLDRKLSESFPEAKTTYFYDGQFSLSFDSDSLTLRAGGSCERRGAHYLVAAFHAKSDVVEWVNETLRSYVGMMHAINKGDVKS
ncbi:MAG: hypothetical protein KKD18_03575, partial [Nanoarchaeota archaeon]|nr:hypothetical protein [Nanoarchaeota archaeon]